MLIAHLGSKQRNRWSATDKTANISLSNGNLTATYSGSLWGMTRAVVAIATGKIYWEISYDNANNATSSGQIRPGLLDGSTVITTDSITNYPGNFATGWDLGANGFGGHNAAFTDGGLGAFAAGDIGGFAWDVAAGKLWYAKNNTWMLSGNPGAGTNPFYTSVTGTLYPTMACYDGTSPAGIGTLKFNLAYAPPSGFIAGLFI